MPATHLNEPVATVGPLDATSGSQVAGVIFPSLSRTNATYNSGEMFNPDAKGLRLYIDLTNVGGAGTVTVTVESRDPVTDNWVTLDAGITTTALAAVATTTLTIYPGVTVVANKIFSAVVATAVRVKAVVGVNAVTFSIGGEWLL
jgi:hypothetical protein